MNLEMNQWLGIARFAFLSILILFLLFLLWQLGRDAGA